MVRTWHYPERKKAKVGFLPSPTQENVGETYLRAKWLVGRSADVLKMPLTPGARKRKKIILIFSPTVAVNNVLAQFLKNYSIFMYLCFDKLFFNTYCHFWTITNYIAKTRQVGGTKNANGMQIFLQLISKGNFVVFNSSKN